MPEFRSRHVPALVPALLLGTLLVTLITIHSVHQAPTVLEEEEAPAEEEGAEAECAEGEDCEEEAEPEPWKRPTTGWRWIKQGANLAAPRATGVWRDHRQSASLNHIGLINPYTDMPYVSQRGLPSMKRRYELPWKTEPWTVKGAKPIFSANMAQRDLDAMKDFGLVSDKSYKKQKDHISDSNLDPFTSVGRDPPEEVDPEGWYGSSSMCRDVTTKSAGLNNQGWAQMHTLRCCNYMCNEQQWQALKYGDLVWGLGENNRYSSAVHTGTTAKMADGSDKYLCRSCAWEDEPTWGELRNAELSKMDGHLADESEEGEEGEEGEEAEE